MLRKHFKKYLPNYETIRNNRYLAWFGSWLHQPNLWHLNRRSVAGGVAVGLFAGLVPGPLQMISGAILAVLFRVNLPVAVVVTLYTNPFTIVPLYLAAYKLGVLVIGDNNSGIPQTAYDFHGNGSGGWLTALLDWIASLGKPLLVGLPLLGILFAITGYIAVRGLWHLYVVILMRRRRMNEHRPH